MPAKKKKSIKKSKSKINKDMTLAEVVSKYPKSIDVLLEHGMGCFGCGAAQFETIEQGAKAHGINLKKLLEELNKKATKKK